MIYLISYDLKTKNKDYSGLYEVIRNCGEWIHPLESLWIVDTRARNLRAEQITDLLRTNMTQDDTLFVCQVDSSDRNGWMVKSAWAWLRAHEEPRAAGQHGNIALQSEG